MRWISLLALAGIAAYVARRRGLSVAQVRSSAKDAVGKVTGDDTLRASAMADKVRDAADKVADRVHHAVNGN
jgi:uncharacterized protein YjbJ (UPF0337 family)